MFHMTIEADNADDFRIKVLNLAKVFGLTQVGNLDQGRPISNIMLQEENMPAADQPAASSRNVTAFPEKRKPGRPPKLNAETQVSEPSVSPQPAYESETPEITPAIAIAPPTKEQAVQALQELNIKKGLETARSVLKKFGCARISELKPEQFTAFIELCSTTANG
jgi:hypothetical protein